MITITKAAADQMRNMIRKTPEATVILMGVTGGGCSGLSYTLRPSRYDAVLMEDPTGKTLWHFKLCYDSLNKSVWVYIDYNSIRYLYGMTVDYVTELIGSRFTFSNPNAAKSCGCGTSFTAKEIA